eukprot:2810088-Amphidinium_carterae.1
MDAAFALPGRAAEGPAPPCPRPVKAFGMGAALTFAVADAPGVPAPVRTPANAEARPDGPPNRLSADLARPTLVPAGDGEVSARAP